METRSTPPETIMRTPLWPFHLILISLLILSSGCQEDVANLDLLQATPVRAVLMIPVSDADAVLHAWEDDLALPLAKEMHTMLSLLPLQEGTQGLLSLHPVGAGGLHWTYTLRRSFTQWHPSLLTDLKPNRRDYASGTIWEWTDSTGSWALAETSEWLILSQTDILAEEGIRQVEAKAGGASYVGYTSLAEQLRSSPMVTLDLNGASPLSQCWPPSDVASEGLPDDLRSWRFQQPGSQAWDVRYTADSTAKVAISTAAPRSESLAFADSTEARAFPGWRWMTPALAWAQWSAVNSHLNFQGHPFAVQAQGECTFYGRRKALHRVTMHLLEGESLQIPHWRTSGDVTIGNDLGLRKPLTLLPFAKTIGPYVLSCEDTAAVNRSIVYLQDMRDSAAEAHYQMAIRYVRSQPSEGQLWWVAKQSNPAAPWAGLTYRAQGKVGYWSAAALLPRNK